MGSGSASLREIVNAIFYLNTAGCQWRALPHDVPNSSTAHTCYRIWQRTGVWPHINRVLPKRWIVERPFGWFGRYRRRSEDY